MGRRIIGFYKKDGKTRPITVGSKFKPNIKEPKRLTRCWVAYSEIGSKNKHEQEKLLRKIARSHEGNMIERFRDRGIVVCDVPTSNVSHFKSDIEGLGFTITDVDERALPYFIKEDDAPYLRSNVREDWEKYWQRTGQGYRIGQAERERREERERRRRMEEHL
jgi:hypothetical protein